MPTGLIIAINASQLLAGSTAGSTAQSARPTHFANPHTFNPIKAIQFQPSLVIVRPTHLANPHTFNPIKVEQDAAAAHRYWRVLVSQNNGSLFTSLGARLEMFAGYDRINLSTASGSAAASASGVFGNVLGGLFDDDHNTQWAVTETGADWVSYDFGSPVSINGLRLQCMSGQAALMPSDFDVQSSDDSSTWSTEWSETGQSWADFEGRFFWKPSYAPSYSGSPLTAARYWQVKCWNHTADTFSCAELIMAIAAAGSQQATGGTAIASNAAFGAAANAFDGNNSTFWAPSNVSGQYIGYDFGAGVSKALAEVRWKSRSAGVAGQNPTRATVRFSYDNALWHPGWETYTGSAWSDGEERTFADPFFI